jgi:hypothetical protein
MRYLVSTGHRRAVGEDLPLALQSNEKAGYVTGSKNGQNLETLKSQQQARDCVITFERLKSQKFFPKFYRTLETVGR